MFNRHYALFAFTLFGLSAFAGASPGIAQGQVEAPNVNSGLQLAQGNMDFDTPDFHLTLVKASQTVYHDREHPSQVVVMVVPGKG